MKIKRIQNFGFTLVELLTVVVIIGILSTVGLPAYQTYSVSTKMAEATVTISSIQKSEITYQSQNDYFISLYRSDNTRPPSKRKAAQIDLTLGWQRIGYPVIAENDYYFTYSSLAGGTYADGSEHAMGMGSDVPAPGTFDGSPYIVSRAIDSGNCIYNVDYANFGFNLTNNERWVVIFASTDFVKTTPIVCATVMTIMRVIEGALTVSPLVTLYSGE